MGTGRYKSWSKEERERSARLVKKAQVLGWIKDNIECERCPQKKGIIQLHCEDYDVTYNTLSVALKREPPSITEEEMTAVNAALFSWCWRCHMIHHSQYRSPEAVKKYFEEVAAGKCYPPVYRHDWSILRRDHGIS